MNKPDAIAYMKSIVEDALPLVNHGGISAAIEVDYMTKSFCPSSFEHAKYLMVSAVLRADGDSRSELAVSLCATVARNSVNEDELECAKEDFLRAMKETADALDAREDKAGTLSSLATEVEEEFQLMMLSIKRSEKRTVLYTVLGIIITVAVFTAVTLFAGGVG